jgi:hypothetical protein
MVEGVQSAREPHLLSLRIGRACANFANLYVGFERHMLTWLFRATG